eukprot:17113-Eustigmatos_ZCMA.PRE.1
MPAAVALAPVDALRVPCARFVGVQAIREVRGVTVVGRGESQFCHRQTLAMPVARPIEVSSTPHCTYTGHQFSDRSVSET